MPATITDRLNGLTTSLAVKPPVRVASTANLTLSGLQTVNSIALAAYDRVLVKNQTNAVENGIYIASTSDWTRAADFDGARDVVQGTLVIVNTNSQGLIYRVTSANPITIGSSTINFAALVDPTQVFPLSQAEIDSGIAPSNYAYAPNNILRYGVTWDRTTDNLAALNRAKAVCMYSRDIYIPPTPAGMFYKYSGTWLLDDLPHGATVHGEGISSLFVNANTSGASAIIVKGGLRVRLQDFAVCGVAGSGHGIELGTEDSGGATHHAQLINMYSAWMDGACYKITRAISVNMENCCVDRNNGFRPFNFTGTGLTEGSPDYGLDVIGRNDGLNNNISCTDCQFNAAGAIASVKVGDTGVLPVQSFSMRGGLIQGSANFQEGFFCVKDSYISCHIEPPVGVTANYVVTMDSCVNTEVHCQVLTGDVLLTGSCSNVRIKGATGCGVVIGPSCVRTVIEDFEERNIITGPAGGKIQDQGQFTTLKRIKNASNERFATGDGLTSPVLYLATDMEDWVGGGSPTVPCGFTVLGAPTITRESSVIRTGTYSAKVVMSADTTQGFYVTIAPANNFVGRMVVVEAWVRNLTTAGLARIGMIEGGSGAAVYKESFFADSWERMLVTFFPSTSATAVTLRFTGNTGTVYWDDIKITCESFTPKKEMTLDGTATPSLSYGGRPVPTLITSGTPTITNFTDPHVGVPFRIKGASATIVTDGGNIKLAGSSNFTFAAGDMLELVYGSDGVFTEVGRTVV